MLMLITVMADTVDTADTVTDTVMVDTAMDTADTAIIMENDLPKLMPIMAVTVMADTAVDTADMVDTATVDVITDKLF